MDEFDEFSVEDWGPESEDRQDMQLWGDNWNESGPDQTFIQKITKELGKQPQKNQIFTSMLTF